MEVPITTLTFEFHHKKDCVAFEKLARKIQALTVGGVGQYIGKMEVLPSEPLDDREPTPQKDWQVTIKNSG